MNTNTIILLILGLLIAYIILSNNQTENFYMNPLPAPTDHRLTSVIIKMLNDIHGLFKRFGIRYWIDAGTLLGAVRYKGIVPGDDDGDLCVLLQDKERFLDLRFILEEMGYGLSEFWAGYKIYPLNGLSVKDHNKFSHPDKTINDIDDREYYDYKLPFIDIFFCNVDPKNPDRIIFSNRSVNKFWPGMYWKTKNVFPLKLYKFNNIVVHGPNDPKQHLDRLYGKKWKSGLVKPLDHEILQSEYITRFNLINKDD